MQIVTFSATAKAPKVDQNALKKAIDMGQQVIEPMKLEQFDQADLLLANERVEIRFSIEMMEPEPEPDEPIDVQGLSDEVEGAE